MSSKRPVKLDINVLPASYHQRRLSNRQIIYILALLILASAALVVYMMASDALARTSDLQEKLDVFSMKVVAIQQMQLRLGVFKGEAAKYQAVLDKRGELTSELQVITEVRVGDVQLTAISLQGRQVTLQGAASDYRTVLYYVTALKERQEFSSVKLASTNRGQYAEIFTIVAEFNP